MQQEFFIKETIFIGFVFLIFLTISYIISCLSTFFIFKSMNISGYLAFIPIYKTYRQLSEYKGRVYKTNWGMLYLINYLFLLIAGAFFVISLNDISKLIIAMLFFTIFSIMSVVVSFLVELPIMYKDSLKTIYIIFFILSSLSGLFTGMLNNLLNNSSYLTSVGVLLVSLLFSVYLIVVYYKVYKKVKNKEAEVVEKINIENLENYEIERILNLRKKILITKK